VPDNGDGCGLIASLLTGRNPMKIFFLVAADDRHHSPSSFFLENITLGICRQPLPIIYVLSPVSIVCCWPQYEDENTFGAKPHHPLQGLTI